MKAAIAELRNKMIILPGITTIERIVNEFITKSDNLVIDIINNSLTESPKKSLDFNEKVIQFVDIGAALIKAKNESLDPFKTIEAVMPWDKIIKFG